MSQPDWSKAPADATHWGPDTGPGGYVACWYKYDAVDGWFYMYEDRLPDAWCPCHGPVSHNRRLQLAKRPRQTFELAKPDTWNGEGLPPVGTVCEYRDAFLKWHQVEIFGIDKVQRRIFASPWTNVPYSACSAPECFRAIRTPEQIAAEEREKAIDEMLIDAANRDNLISLDLDSRAVAAALYGAGYRKVGVQ